MKIKHFIAVFFGIIMILKPASAQNNPENARMLMQAAKYKDFNSIRQMMSNGADINFRDSQGNTLYCLAVKNRDKQTADILKSFGGTMQGCPEIDPNYKPPRKTYYEEKSGAFAGSKIGEYALLGGAAVGIAYFLTNGAEDSGETARNAETSNEPGTGTRPANSTVIVIPDDPVSTVTYLADVEGIENSYEFYFTSNQGIDALDDPNEIESHWERIGLQNAFARGYQGDLVNRDSDGVIGNPIYNNDGVKIAIVDTAGVDQEHLDFFVDEDLDGVNERFDGSFADGSKYDFTDQSNENYDGSEGVPSPFFVTNFDSVDGPGDGIDFVDSFATQTAGIIGATWNDTGMTGIAPLSQLQTYAMGDSPFDAFVSAVGNNADAITYNATKNLMDVVDGNAVLDIDYMASSLYFQPIADRKTYFEEQINSGYGAGTGTIAKNFYNSFGTMAVEDRPIMVISTGNDTQNIGTTIEAGAPIAFPELLGNFISATGVDENGDLYRQNRVGSLGENYTFGSNGCGYSMNWCLSAPGDEVITTAAGTGNLLNYEHVDDTTNIELFRSNTNGDYKLLSDADGDGAWKYYNDVGMGSWDTIATDDAGFSILAKGFFLDREDHDDALSDYSEVYTPLDLIVYDVNRDGEVVGKRMDLFGGATGPAPDPAEGEADGDQTGDWETWGYKDVDADEWHVGASTSTFADFYFIDKDQNGFYSPGDFLYIPMLGSAAATAIVAGGVGLVKSAFPHMTNEQITALLFLTATDLGDAGVDMVFGHGLMDLDKAFQPFGEVRVPINWETFDWNVDGDYSAGGTSGGTAQSARGPTLPQSRMNLGTAFGDAGSNLENLSFVGIDEFNRGFSYSMSNFVSSSATLPSIYEMIQDFGSEKTIDTKVTDNLSFSMTKHANVDDAPVKLKMTIDRDTSEIQASFGENSFSFFEEQGGETGSIIRKDIVYNPFMSLIDEQNMGVKYGVDLTETWKLSSMVSHGQNNYEDGIARDPYLMQNQLEQEQYEGTVSVSMMRLQKNFEDMTFAFDGGVAYEEKTMLGAVNEGAFETEDGTITQFYSLNFSANPTELLRFFGGYTKGITEVKAGENSFFTDLSKFETSSFHVGADYKINKKTSFGMIVAQPLRIDKANANLEYAISRDSVENNFVVESHTVNLTPTAHETDIQAFLSHKTDGVTIDFGVLYQHNPAHSKELPDDTTGIISFKWAMQ